MSYKGNNIQGWMSDIELNWLYETALTMDSILEIGCWKGRSTHALLSGCKGVVFAVDHFRGNPDQINKEHKEASDGNLYHEFMENTVNFDNLVTMKADANDVVKFFKPKSIEMIFIDGRHLTMAVISDILNWMPICKTLLCGHDYNMEGVYNAILGINLPIKIEAGTIWSYQIEGNL
jgi:hypothetical protein